jgi:hypothetical protein
MSDAAYRLTKHAIARFRERIGPRAEPTIKALAADAHEPTDAEWVAILKEKRSRQTSRADTRVLGSIVFVVDGGAVVTVWRCMNLVQKGAGRG